MGGNAIKRPGKLANQNKGGAAVSGNAVLRSSHDDYWRNQQAFEERALWVREMRKLKEENPEAFDKLVKAGFCNSKGQMIDRIAEVGCVSSEWDKLPTSTVAETLDTVTDMLMTKGVLEMICERKGNVKVKAWCLYRLLGFGNDVSNRELGRQLGFTESYIRKVEGEVQRWIGNLLSGVGCDGK